MAVLYTNYDDAMQAFRHHTLARRCRRIHGVRDGAKVDILSGRLFHLHFPPNYRLRRLDAFFEFWKSLLRDLVAAGCSITHDLDLQHG